MPSTLPAELIAPTLTVDEFGMGKVVDNDETITQKAVGKKSRTGGVVKKPTRNRVLAPPMTTLQHIISI
jgi:hypothetical protein